MAHFTTRNGGSGVVLVRMSGGMFGGDIGQGTTIPLTGCGECSQARGGGRDITLSL